MSDFKARVEALRNSAALFAAANSNQPSLAPRPTPQASPPSKRARSEPAQLSAVPVERVFIVCPYSAITGGPEALHQLCSKINSVHSSSIRARNEDAAAAAAAAASSSSSSSSSSSASASESATTAASAAADASPPLAMMLYTTVSVRGSEKRLQIQSDALPPPQYGHYNTPVTSVRPSLPSDLVIWPETFTSFLDGTFSPAVQKASWWLSVDNNAGQFTDFSRPDIFHLCQSEYSLSYLRDKESPNLSLLTEFIPPGRVPPPVASPPPRQPVVLYNPAKGLHYTAAVRSRSEPSGKFTFVPIRNMSPSEVVSTMQRSKVYIDFGEHPGMDRIPREAALCGLIVVTNKKGAANFASDVPIPEEFKVGEPFDEDKIHCILVKAVEDFDLQTKKFDDYRAWIMGQEAVMDQRVKEFLDNIVLKKK